MRDADILAKRIAPAWLELARELVRVPTAAELQARASQRGGDLLRLAHWIPRYCRQIERMDLTAAIERDAKRRRKRPRKSQAQEPETRGQMTMAL